MARTSTERMDPAADPDASWLQVPAIYCDTFTTGGMSDSKAVRIVFGDYVSGKHYPFYRSAVIMPLSDVKALVRNLNRRIKELEEGEEAEKKDEHQSSAE